MRNVCHVHTKSKKVAEITLISDRDAQKLENY
jgi:hypothetical protein